MLVNNTFFVPKAIVIMSDMVILAALVKTTLLEIAHQAEALGQGLQNAAPTGKPNNSVQYLLKIAEQLKVIAARCDQMTNP